MERTAEEGEPVDPRPSDPLPESPAVEAPPETGDQALPGRRPAARGRLVIGGLLAATAVIFGGAGVLVGLWLAPDPRPAGVLEVAQHGGDPPVRPVGRGRQEPGYRCGKKSADSVFSKDCNPQSYRWP
jgi:hypothetical protein